MEPETIKTEQEPKAQPVSEAPKAEEPTGPVEKFIHETIEAGVPGVAKPAFTRLKARWQELGKIKWTALAIAGAAVLAFWYFIYLPKVQELKTVKDNIQQYGVLAGAPKVIGELDTLIKQDPTNRQLFIGIKKELERFTESPRFSLYLADQEVTNDAKISLPSRQLNFRIRNDSTVTADKVRMAITLPLPINPTNFIAVKGWSKEGGYAGYDGKLVANNWLWIAEEALAGTAYYWVDTFSIATNCPFSTFEVRAEVYSAGSTNRIYRFSVKLGP